jgi:hypothetical protein
MESSRLIVALGGSEDETELNPSAALRSGSEASRAQREDPSAELRAQGSRSRVLKPKWHEGIKPDRQVPAAEPRSVP